MIAKVQKWGNSLAVRIPKAFADEMGLEDNGPVELCFVDGELHLKPIRKRRYTLRELVSQITEENRHEEIDSGLSVGNEVW